MVQSSSLHRSSFVISGLDKKFCSTCIHEWILGIPTKRCAGSPAIFYQPIQGAIVLLIVASYTYYGNRSTVILPSQL